MKDNKKQIYQKINSNLANLLNSKSLELYRIMEFQMGINNTDELNPICSPCHESCKSCVS